MHFFIMHWGLTYALLDPYGIISQIKISIKHVAYLLLYNLQLQVVLRWIGL